MANDIEIWGARANNLKNVDVKIPHDKLTVVTGLSGSGKSSLAFDTIYAEGQRRYIETFNAYARNFLDNVQRPDVDKITGLSPVISISQKTTNRNPRSTVGTITEVYDFLRLLYARIGEAYSYASGEKMVKYTEEKIIQMLSHDYAGHRIYILAPLVRNRKGHYRELFDSIRRKGFIYARVDGEMVELKPHYKVDRYKNHTIEVVIDKLRVATPGSAENEADQERLRRTVLTAFRQGDGMLTVLDADTKQDRHYSKHLMCPVTGISYRDPSPHDFSFNSTQGACPHCKGLGVVNDIDINKVIPDPQKSIHDGGIIPLGKAKKSLIFIELQALLMAYDCDLDTPISEIPEEAITEILQGSTRDIRIPAELIHTSNDHFVKYPGIVKHLQQMADGELSASAEKWVEQFNRQVVCPECGGRRLNKIALHYLIDGKSIADVSEMDLVSLSRWINELPPKLNANQQKIGEEIIKEINNHLRFLLDVGLGYLSLSRGSATLSGGESQRIRLATQIGSGLVNVIYILDEPSIGLHQRDNMRLIRALQALRDSGNTIIVVEHDKDMMLHADNIVDVGPMAGRHGGKIVFSGKPSQMLRSNTLTAQYLNGKKQIDIPQQRRTGNGLTLKLIGATGNNLKNIDLTLPLGKMICVTGVSGSGKSSLITNTLLPILSHHFYRSLDTPLPYKSIQGIENIDKVISVDQSPIGRTPRSNPATYTGVFSDIRNLFVQLPEAAIRGYKPGRFSFNTSGGRCEECKGNGYKVIEMNFLPSVTVPCQLCHGKRYNRETLEVRFKGKSIADILDMTVDQAVEFFEAVPNILRKIKTLQDVGLGYIRLGQSSTTLSGGESQRIKLATELSKRDTGRTLYILDEPTTGLHFEDIRILNHVLNRLVDKGNTVIIIEHNLDVIKIADHIIDMGPEGGDAGGMIVAEGTPEQVAADKNSITAPFLKKELGI
ncbi:MAG: excinuclease ABC subunit UvrA [Bacteroidaceae bacterium]|nr:excinuclease ABC subunit UvrA [Bacteroidaceae bacterium]MBR4782760.1 excinuclease ABC subunit UvrA [Bacteroidaceae bacterium]